MACQLGESGTRTEAIQSRARRIYGILGTAIVVRTRGGTPVRVGVFVDVCVGAEGARAVKPLERLGPTRYGHAERSRTASSALLAVARWREGDLTKPRSPDRLTIVLFVLVVRV